MGQSQTDMARPVANVGGNPVYYGQTIQGAGQSMNPGGEFIHTPQTQATQGSPFWNNVRQSLAVGMMSFGDSMSHGHTLDNYMEAQRQKQNNQLRMDAELGIKGYSRVDNIAGKPVSKDTIRVGDSYYMFNPELAQRFGSEPMTQEDLKTVNDKLNKQLGTTGKWIPSTQRVGGATYRYEPALNEKYNFGDSEPEDEIAQAIKHYQSKGMSKEEIIAGIKSEGADPAKYQSLLDSYIPANRRSFIENIMFRIGLNPVQNQPIVGALSGDIEKRKSKFQK